MASDIVLLCASSLVRSVEHMVSCDTSNILHLGLCHGMFVLCLDFGIVDVIL